eukprot:3662604-Prymnesium_polylepis.1
MRRRVDCAATCESTVWTVVHHSRVFVRDRPSRSAERLWTVAPGELVEAVADSRAQGWVRLVDSGGWVLIDGSTLGLGRLLKRVEPQAPLWRVVHHGRCAVREARSTSSELVNTVAAGELVQGRRRGDWLELATGGWMLIDGAELGLG